MSNTSPPLGTTQDQLDAQDIVNNFLQQADLQSLGNWAWQEITQGASADKVELDLYQQQAFQNRFPAIFARQKSGLPALSVADYLNYESSADQLLRASGIDPKIVDVNNELANDVSINELTSKVTNAYAQVAQAPDSVRTAFRNFFGPSGDAALATYILDPAKAMPILTNQINTAMAAGIGTQYGLNLNQKQAGDLGQAQGGSSLLGQGQLDSGFQQVQKLSPLFQEQVGETKDLTAEDQGVNAAFNLNDQDAADVANRLATRVAAGKGTQTTNVSDRGFLGSGGTLA